MPSVSLNSPVTSPGTPARSQMSSSVSPSSPPGPVRGHVRGISIPSAGAYSQSAPASAGFAGPSRSQTVGSLISLPARMSASPTPPIANPSTPSWNSSLGALLIPTDRAQDDLEEIWLPRLGRLRVEREVRVPGYSLYGIRSWYLSRTHWAFAIAASTGKPMDTITCYVVVPAADLSEKAGAAELEHATNLLARETSGFPRKTEFGTLLVSTPAGYRQDVSPIPGGDMREAWPFIVLNTALRRLGCGGRAALGNEFPVPAVRRKFYELYRITPPKTATDETPTGSPPASPTHSQGHYPSLSSSTASAMTNGSTASGLGQPTAEQVASNPVLLNIVELVKLLQASLALWGMYGTAHEEVEIDGLFCDETKAGMFAWRRLMGMESDDGFKLAKETSGGCIDPRTLCALLSSVTSVRYQLASLGVEKLPKDPFANVRQFLKVWRAHQTSLGAKKTDYLSVASIRGLSACYVTGRKTHATDALKVHKFLLSGVASATSTISANLKGGTADDSTTPLRKREQHMCFEDDGDESGIGLIVPEGGGGGVAAPDTITTDLEAYRKLLEKSREKEWDVMGARRIAELMAGHLADRGPERDGSRHHGRLLAFRRLVPQDDEEEGVGAAAIGAFKGMTTRTGNALKGGFGLVGRRHGSANAYDTSDSEGPSRHKLRKSQTVPTVVEPDPEERSPGYISMSRSPSPSNAREALQHSTTSPNMSNSLRAPHQSHPAVHSPLHNSVYLSGDFSDVSGRSGTASPIAFDGRSFRSSAAFPAESTTAPQMLRTRSGPADVQLSAAERKSGNSRTDLSPQGRSTAPFNRGFVLDGEMIRGQGNEYGPPLRRTQSFTCASEYRGVRRKQPRHLAIDVEMCSTVWELMKKEKELARKATDMQMLERATLAAGQMIFDARDARIEKVAGLEAEASTLVSELEMAAATGVEDDQTLQRAANNVQYFLSEDTNTNELIFALQDLQKAWESMREEHNKSVDVVERLQPKGWWWLG